MSFAKAESQYDILIRNARLLNAPGKQMSIAVAGGRIAALAETIDGRAVTEIDAKGMLVSESFVNPHLHLCKVFTLQMMDEEALKDYHGAGMGKAMTAIELAGRVKEKYDRSWILPNVRKAVAQAAVYGCTHIRAFADVDSKARLEGVEALIQARDEFKDVVDIQVVAFAQEGRSGRGAYRLRGLRRGQPGCPGDGERHRIRNVLTMKAMLTIPVLVLLIAGSRTALSAASAESAKPETPDFGPPVLIFDASMTDMQSRIDEIFRQQERSQFGSNRYALFFKPGKYDLDVQVGFYTQVLGLGRDAG